MFARLPFGRMTAALAVVGLTVGLGSAAVAGSASRPVIAEAEATVAEIKADPQFKGLPGAVGRSYGVMIIPELTRGGIGIGGEGGTGVLLVRQDQGWSDPIFMDLAGVSIGPQLGVETVKAVMTIQDKGTLDAILRSGLRLGAEASAVAGDQGRRVEGAMSHNAQGPIRLFSHSEGVYAGASLKGVRVAVDVAKNADFYGRSVTVDEIVSGQATAGGAAGLKSALSTQP